MDVQRTRLRTCPAIDDPDLGGVLRLGGALRVPRRNFTEDELKIVDAFENWDEPYPHPFQRALAAFVNLADDYAERPRRPRTLPRPTSAPRSRTTPTR